MNMAHNPTDPATNVLYNAQAMAILEDACSRLKALGLHCGFGPDTLFPESEMTAVLRVSTSARSIEESIAGSLLASEHAMSTTGRKVFEERLSHFRADCAIGKAMDTPNADSA